MVTNETPLDYINSLDPSVKKEPFDSQMDSVFLPPVAFLFSPTATLSLPSTSCCRAPASSLAGTKRLHPYLSPHREIGSRKREPGIMSTNAGYGIWSQSGSRHGNGRSHPPVGRRTSDGDDEHNAQVSQTFMNGPYFTPTQMRPLSSGSNQTSSLTGAMGEANISGLPGQPQDLWDQTLVMQNAGYPGVAGPGGMTYANSASSPYSNRGSPESLSPCSPGYPQMYNESYQLPRGVPSGSTGYSIDPQAYHAAQNQPVSDDARRLRRRVQELEAENALLRGMQGQMGNLGGLPNPSYDPAFQSAWRNRTEARKRAFCSLNRAGNALCAWHDSRRERRAYPPRNAPAGYLNCGCTHEQALFEESLSRHGVGSYHPGENVRMDPALRNPLLKLLETRYGYKDGDFDHNPATMAWIDGQSPADWETKAHSGAQLRRRQEDRH